MTILEAVNKVFWPFGWVLVKTVDTESQRIVGWGFQRLEWYLKNCKDVKNEAQP